jgi:hypothetical protein
MQRSPLPEFRRSSATSNALLKMNTAASPRISRPGGSAPNPRTAHRALFAGKPANTPLQPTSGASAGDVD